MVCECQSEADPEKFDYDFFIPAEYLNTFKGILVAAYEATKKRKPKVAALAVDILENLYAYGIDKK